MRTADGRRSPNELSGSGAARKDLLVWDGTHWTPRAPAAVASRNTVVAGLPSLVDRSVGDLTFDPTTGRPFIETGLPGTVYLDTFNDAASGANINGRTVPGTAIAWSGDAGVVGDGAGRLYKNDGFNTTFRGGTFEVPNSGDQPIEVVASTYWPSIATSNCLVGLILRGTTDSDGYYVTVGAYDGVRLQVVINRLGVKVWPTSGFITTAPVTDATTHTFSVTLSGSTLSVFWDGASVTSYTDGAVLSGTTTTRKTQGFLIGTGARIDSYQITAGSTLAWTPAVTGLFAAIATKTGAYTMTALDGVILANGTFTVTLPPVSSSGIRYTVKNIGTGTVTVSPASGTIDGAASKSLAVQYATVDVVSDGTNWFTV